MAKAAAQKAPNAVRDLEKDMRAAAALKAQLKDILGDGLDALTLRDTIEGETDLFETVDAVVAQIGEDEARAGGIAKFMSSLAARKQRLENRADTMRTMLTNTLDMLEEKRLERPLATVTFKLTPPKLNVTDEAMVPSNYWKTPEPVLAKKELGDALKARKEALDQLAADKAAGRVDDAAYPALLAKIEADHPIIPGAELDNGSATVQILFS